MASRNCCERACYQKARLSEPSSPAERQLSCYDHAQQRSLYRHALNALLLASRSGCDSKMARELAERCEEMLRAADRDGEDAVVAKA